MQAKIINDVKLPNYIIELGVLAFKSNRNDTSTTGVTNAELMYIHENGSPLRHIPARPVLKMAMDWAKSSGLVIQTVGKVVAIMNITGKQSDATNEMKKMAIKIQNYARQIIYDNDGRLAPNAPSTIAKKGDNHPLFDTGQLARSITCRVIKQ